MSLRNLSQSALTPETYMILERGQLVGVYRSGPPPARFVNTMQLDEVPFSASRRPSVFLKKHHLKTHLLAVPPFKK